MSHTEILEKFGEIVVERVYDEYLHNYKTLRAGDTKWGIGKEYTEVLNKLKEEDKDVLYKLHEASINTAIFSFLQIFEDHSEFKIVYEENGKQIDLNKLSEMLKSEHHNWISKYSKEFKNNDIK